eukprot:364367-Chlamydomonas_euryale.AAC.18
MRSREPSGVCGVGDGGSEPGCSHVHARLHACRSYVCVHACTCIDCRPRHERMQSALSLPTPLSLASHPPCPLSPPYRS